MNNTNSEKPLLPQTLFGRAVFLLFCVQAFVVFFVNFRRFLYYVISLCQSGFDTIKERVSFAIETSDVGKVLLTNLLANIVDDIPTFITFGFELAIVWMLVYVVFRFSRNRQPTPKDFFVVSVVAATIQNLTYVFVNLFNGDFENISVSSIFIFLFCVIVAHIVFSRPITENKVLPKEYICALCKYLLKNRYFYIVFALYLLSNLI